MGGNGDWFVVYGNGLWHVQMAVAKILSVFCFLFSAFDFWCLFFLARHIRYSSVVSQAHGFESAIGAAPSGSVARGGSNDAGPSVWRWLEQRGWRL